MTENGRSRGRNREKRPSRTGPKPAAACIILIVTHFLLPGDNSNIADEIKTEKCDAKKDFSFAVCRRRTPKSLHALSDLRALTCRGMCLRVFVKHLYNHQAMRHGPVAVGEWRVSVAYIDCDAVALVVWQERAVARQPADLVLAEAPQQPPRHLGLCMYYSCGLGHEHSTCTLPKSLLCFKDWHELLPTPLLGSLEICTRP
ncbi:hypothetical protein BN1723_016692 [Verticillium longisporum]|uniref:Uncharacterized protein n=1 Tax=Verticillium longisporum TaxID=100787 RepID=A0A0G4NJS3_VERLO|nr:hypothetical protein BN1723_016692 [Verticillium longisporum]